MPPQQRAEHSGSRSRSARKPASRRYAGFDHAGPARNFLIEPSRLGPERNQDGGPWTDARPVERRGRHTGEILALQADLARQQAEMAAIIARVSGILEALVADGVVDVVAAQRARGTNSQPEGTDRVLTGLLVMILFLTLVLAALVYVLATGGVLGLPFTTS